MKHMDQQPKISIGYIGINDDEQDIGWGGQHGLFHIEYNYHLEFDSTFPNALNLHIWLRRHSVHACAVGCWGQELISKDNGKRKAATERVRATIDFAKAIGSPIVMAGGGDREGDSLSAKLADVVEVYKPIEEYAASQGVKLCFYNCHWVNCVTGPAAWDVVLKQLPSIGIKFDPSHPYQSGEDPYQHLADYGQHVVHFHAKEVLSVGGSNGKMGTLVDEPMAGQGDFDWGRLIGTLYKHRYNGVISIEPHSETWSGPMRRPGILIAKRELERHIV